MREPRRDIRVMYIYKDFDIYNGLIETFLILSEKQATLPFGFKVCVFRNKKIDYAEIFKGNGGTLINLRCRWSSNPLIVFRLYQLFRRERPDVVQTFVLKPNLFGIIAALLANVPVAIATDLTLKDQAPTRLRRLRDRLLFPLYASVSNRADHVICVSEAIREDLTQLGVRTGISVITPPIDLRESAKYAKARENCPGEPQKDITIGIVGRLSEEKRHADLLEAFSLLLEKYSEISLLIVGEGPLRPRLEAQARHLEISHRVSFAGFQKDVFRYLSLMDIFALPSRTEGTPLAAMEAMAYGLPVVASRVGGIPEIVDDQVTGILFDAGNVAQLSRALAQLIEDPEKRRVFGENGKNKAYRSFSPDAFIESHYRLYLTLLDNPSRPRLRR